MDRIKLFLFILILGLLVFIRPINHDESYYSISANEILHGEMPYSDFLFHQLPFMLAVYSIVSWHGFWSLIAGRLLSYALYLFALYLIKKYLVEVKPGKLILFLFLFLLNLFLLNWILIIKIYPLSILLFTAGCILLNKFIEGKETSQRGLQIFFAGLFFSLLLLTRIVFAANLLILFIFLIYLLFRLNLSSKLKFLLSFLAGSILPLLIFSFIFRNEFHNIYLNTVYLNNIMRTDQVDNFIKSFIAYQYVIFIPQNLIMILIIIIGWKKFSLIEVFYLINIIFFYIIHIFTQMYIEYLIPVLPLLCILAYNRYDTFEEKITNYFKFRKNKFRIGFLITFLIVAPPGVTHLKHILEGHDVMISPIELHKISKELDKVEGSSVLAGWEGYSFYSSKNSFVKNEYCGSFFFNLKEKLDTSVSSRILFPIDFKNFIIKGLPDIIVYDENDPRYLTDLYGDINRNYNLVQSIKNLKFFKRK